MSGGTGGVATTTPALREREWQKRVTDLCRWLNLLYFHSTDSRRDTTSGWPDLFIVGPTAVIAAELKTDRGRVSPDQTKWLLALELAGVEAVVWRPAMWPEVERRLRDLAARTTL